MSRTVFIVEGWKDAYQVKGALDNRCEVIVTGGTRINNRIKDYIEFYILYGYNVYILSDPDEAGNQLANMIEHAGFNLPRIHADYEKCKYCKDIFKSKFKAGIEHASYKYLRELLEPYLEEENHEMV